MYKPYPGELITNVGTMYCPGASVTITIYTPYGFYYDNNQFKIQLSDVNGVFSENATSNIIGTRNSNTGGQVTITFASNLPASKKYRIRAISTSPRAVGAPSRDINISPPYIELDSVILNGICLGDNLLAPIHSNACFNADNVYTLQLSAANGSFSNPTILATRAGNGSLTFTASIPDTILTNT